MSKIYLPARRPPARRHHLVSAGDIISYSAGDIIGIRTLADLNRNRRLVKDFEAFIARAKAWVYIASPLCGSSSLAVALAATGAEIQPVGLHLEDMARAVSYVRIVLNNSHTRPTIDGRHAIILDVEATSAIRQAEILAARRMTERSMECFDFYPARLIGDSTYGSAEMNWLVHDRGIEPHIRCSELSQSPPKTDLLNLTHTTTFDLREDC